MNISTNSTIAELRNELERKRSKAQELQLDTTDPDDWAALNTLRWELEDLDKDIYLAQFIKNNEKLSKLTGVIKQATTDAQKIVKTIDNIEQSVKSARKKLKSTSQMFNEITSFMDDIDEMINVLKA